MEVEKGEGKERVPIFFPVVSLSLSFHFFFSLFSPAFLSLSLSLSLSLHPCFPSPRLFLFSLLHSLPFRPKQSRSIKRREEEEENMATKIISPSKINTVEEMEIAQQGMEVGEGVALEGTAGEQSAAI